MDEQTVPCGCGCGFRLGPSMYGRLIRGRWYAQGCVGPVVPVQISPADTAVVAATTDPEFVVAA